MVNCHYDFEKCESECECESESESESECECVCVCVGRATPHPTKIVQRTPCITSATGTQSSVLHECW